MQAVAHNLTAMFTDRQLNISTKDKGKSVEKLNTGYRINRASDDAAGLTISEGMRWQVRGLNKAEHNCEDGASFCQVADGAMSEIEDILQRMRELSVQASNDTNTPEDRAAIQSEINELVAEVGDITSDTKFNDIDVFGWDRERVEYKQNAAGEWISTGEKVTITVNGNNYGLAEVVGKDHIWMDNHLSDAIQFSSDGKWVSTGQLKWSGWNEDELKTRLSNKSSQTLANQVNLKTSTLPTGGKSVFEDQTNGYQCTVTYDPDVKTLDGQYVATNIWVVKGTLDPAGSGKFLFDGSNKVEAWKYSLPDRYPGLQGFDNKEEYACAWIDFSELGKKYDVSSLFGQGFNSSCATCNDHYSINFTDKVYDNSLSTGLSYQLSGKLDGYPVSPRLDIGIGGCTSGEQLVKSILEAVNSCPSGSSNRDFGNHYTQYAYHVDEPAKIYLYDNGEYTYKNKNDVANSSFEPAMRDESNRLVVKDTVLTNMDSNPTRWIYSTKEMWIQSGTTENSGFFIGKPKVNPALLGIDSMSVMDYDQASDSIITCDFAIDMLNEERSKMGAQQNRLEIAARVDASTGENTQAAESRIRDADMAEEMVDYSKHNILEQAGMSLLAQANQSMQGVVTILGS